MTIKADRAEVCWEPVYRDGGAGYYHDNDYWPHFKTRAACAEAIAEIVADHDDEDGPLHLICAPCFTGPCVVIVCDGCGEVFDYEGDGGMHFDPADPIPVPLEDCDWHEIRGKHYCDGCGPFECDDCEERHEQGEPCIDATERRPVPVHPDQAVIPW